MKKYIALLGAAGGVVMGFSGAAFAASNGPLSLSISAGAQYDDNITVDAQDLTTNKSDKAAVIEGAAGFKFINTKSLKLEAGYDFYQTLHKDLTNFDLQIHGLSLSASSDIGGAFDVGGSYRFDHVLLGGSSFLDMHTVRPSVGYSIDNLHLVAAYEYQHRNFRTPATETRDANDNSGSLTAYYIPASGTVLSAGYKLTRETAVGPEFDYWGHFFDVGAKVTLPLGVIDPIFRASYRYYQKNYSNITPLINTKRDDKRHNFKTSLQVPIVAGVFTKLQYEYTKAISNLPSADYHENVVTLSLGWEL
jgi:hypothetical protein